MARPDNQNTCFIYPILFDKPTNILSSERVCIMSKTSKTTRRLSIERLEDRINPNTTLNPGLPGSPGKVTGPCFRVLDPADFARFPKGAILVARTTNPAWTPLFYSASGLITESGGPLSHGAVTAREMALLAVMSVRDVLSKVRDGQIVTVDGTQGLEWIEAQGKK